MEEMSMKKVIVEINTSNTAGQGYVEATYSDDNKLVDAREFNASRGLTHPLKSVRFSEEEKAELSSRFPSRTFFWTRSTIQEASAHA